ncbi:hypothetical protein DQ04_07751010 [Trypanosoma grayi]|uniref:hypothetical protein n=1 Tax=Trypanosoma grayi TaxID=71804 RepID=UPI0004F48981|nr:hypothetical protein DQ04_07751010 [Trypanosoma grayi]KEG08202.1 hypothetical protein DQ04_07751010 [Trypanosoma grayi]
MEVPIFSVQGYTAYAGKILGGNGTMTPPTKEQYDTLVAAAGGDAMQHVKESESTTTCINDAVLMDAGTLSLAFPSSSGFVTLKLVDAVGSKNTPRARAAYVLSPAASRGSSATHSNSLRVSTGASTASAGVDTSSGSGLLAPMTPIITCKPVSKNWPRMSSHTDTALDAHLIQFFRDAAVVSVNTMRLLGAEEGAAVRLECHEERSVGAGASTIVFALTAGSVGEELSFDKYMRHFIAPFFLRGCRAVSVGEEFEFKNHDYGDLHVTVIGIDDGMVECGLVTDQTRIRLVVQPGAPPNLQGRGSGPMPEILALRSRSTSTHRRTGGAKQPYRPRESSQNDADVSPRPTDLSGLLPRSLTSPMRKDGGAQKGKPPRVHEPSPQRVSQSAEPHSPASFRTYSPQTLKGDMVLMAKPLKPRTLLCPLKAVGMSGVSGPKDPATPGDAPVAASLVDSLLSSTKPENEGTKTMQVQNPHHHASTQISEDASARTGQGHSPPEENRGLETPTGSSLPHSITPVELRDASSRQSNVEISFSHPRQVEQWVEAESCDSRKDEARPGQSGPPGTLSHSESTLSQKAVDLMKMRKPRCQQDKPGNSDASSQLDLHGDEASTPTSQNKGDHAQEQPMMEVPPEPARELPQELVEEVVQGHVYEPDDCADSGGTDAYGSLTEANTPMVPLHGRRDKCTQYEEQNSAEQRLCDAQEGRIQRKDAATEPIQHFHEEILSEAPPIPPKALPQEHEQCEKNKPESNLCSNGNSNVITQRGTSSGPEKLTHDVVLRANHIVQMWLTAKDEWEKLPISPLLKGKPYKIIKRFQHFLAVYKELKQRHADCLAYLDSPYGHTMRGGMVVRISLSLVQDGEDVCDSAAKASPGIVGSYRSKSDTGSHKGNNDGKDNDASDSDSEALSLAKATELLCVSLRDISAALGCDVLHVFRVGGTCPTLYCSLVKPYTNSSCEISLLGESCPVEVLQTTIMEALCEAREESRREWGELSLEWTEAISSVLRLGVFAKHLQTIRELFWELALLLRHPGEVRHSAKYQRSVSRRSPNKNDEFEVRNHDENDTYHVQAPLPLSHSAPGTLRRTPADTEYEGFVPYLQELQDMYYLYSELLEPFVLQSLHQVDTVSAATDAVRCEEVVRFLKASYRAQMTEEREDEEEETNDTVTPLRSVAAAAAEEERAAFAALVEARRAGVIMPLPNEWWENGVAKEKSYRAS